MSKKTMDTKHGGARPGAGRKCLAPDQKKVSVTISVSARTAKMLREIRQSGRDINGLLEMYICDLHEEAFHREPIVIPK